MCIILITLNLEKILFMLLCILNVNQPGTHKWNFNVWVLIVMYCIRLWYQLTYLYKKLENVSKYSLFILLNSEHLESLYCKYSKIRRTTTRIMSTIPNHTVWYAHVVWHFRWSHKRILYKRNSSILNNYYIKTKLLL